jgi:hypothetical protein
MWDACFESLKQVEKTKGSGCILAHCMGLGKTFQVRTISLVITSMFVFPRNMHTYMVFLSCFILIQDSIPTEKHHVLKTLYSKILIFCQVSGTSCFCNDIHKCRTFIHPFITV